MSKHHVRNPIKRHGDTPRDHFTIVPNELARDTELGLYAYRAAIVIRTHAENYEVSAASLAKMLGWHRDTAGKALRELVAARWLAIRTYKTAGGGRAFDEYHVHAPESSRRRKRQSTASLPVRRGRRHETLSHVRDRTVNDDVGEWVKLDTGDESIFLATHLVAPSLSPKRNHPQDKGTTVTAATTETWARSIAYADCVEALRRLNTKRAAEWLALPEATLRSHRHVNDRGPRSYSLGSRDLRLGRPHRVGRSAGGGDGQGRRSVTAVPVTHTAADAYPQFNALPSVANPSSIESR